MPSWTRLKRDQAAEVLTKMGTAADAIIFSKEATEVAFKNLPFYGRFKLLRLTNFATMPSFTMEYLSDGERYIPLDGTAAPVYEANDKDHIRLTESNVVDYLDFFFSHVQGADGDIFLVKDPHKLTFLQSFTPEQQQSLIQSHKPVRVVSDATPHSFHVSGTLYYDGSLISATIHADADGKLSIFDQTLLLQGIHFPHDALAQQWAIGE